jgi:hypothetical protein
VRAEEQARRGACPARTLSALHPTRAMCSLGASARSQAFTVWPPMKGCASLSAPLMACTAEGSTAQQAQQLIRLLLKVSVTDMEHMHRYRVAAAPASRKSLSPEETF